MKRSRSQRRPVREGPLPLVKMPSADRSTVFAGMASTRLVTGSESESLKAASPMEGVDGG